MHQSLKRKPLDRAAAIQSALRTIATEQAGVAALAAALENGLAEPFAEALSRIAGISGRVIVTGVGKSGHIGAKIAATLASTGTPAFFVHPAEMSHGDLGMLQPDVTLLAISSSGESRELRDPLIFCQRAGIPVIGMTQRPASFLGRSSTVCLAMPPFAEACPNNLAPTTSTLMTLALGDALAMVLMERRGFTAEAFGLRHPGGKLGMRLQSVRDWMGDRPPAPAVVPTSATFAEVVTAITEGRKGAVAVVADDGRLAGIITDGDVRRAFARDVSGLTAGQMMSPSPKVVAPDARMSDAIDLMTQNKIATLLVVEAGRPAAIVHIAELMQAGYVG